MRAQWRVTPEEEEEEVWMSTLYAISNAMPCVRGDFVFIYTFDWVRPMIMRMIFIPPPRLLYELSWTWHLPVMDYLYTLERDPRRRNMDERSNICDGIGRTTTVCWLSSTFGPSGLCCINIRAKHIATDLNEKKNTKTKTICSEGLDARRWCTTACVQTECWTQIYSLKNRCCIYRLNAFLYCKNISSKNLRNVSFKMNEHFDKTNYLHLNNVWLEEFRSKKS